MNDKIDFVITWVDGSDEKWLEEKNQYSENKIDTTNSALRFRDMKLLKYWFRGVEKFTPWVNKIHFVTWGHVPEWLNLENPKLNVVNHKDFIPKEYLPTFNSNAIEYNLHRIEGLTEKFVYFNDDMFILKPIGEEYFFKNGLPCDLWRDNIPYYDKNSDLNFEHTLVNDKMLISRNFIKRDFMKNNLSKWLNFKYGKRNIRFMMLYKWPYMAGFDNFHMSFPFLKSTFNKMWEKENDVIDLTCRSKFRSWNNVTPYSIVLWQIYSGKFEPKSYKKTGKYFNLSGNRDELFDCILNQREEQICINDTDEMVDYEAVTEELRKCFDKIFPDKSSFEK